MALRAMMAPSAEDQTGIWLLQRLIGGKEVIIHPNPDGVVGVMSVQLRQEDRVYYSIK